METAINNQFPVDLDDGKRKRENELIQKAKTQKPNEEAEVNLRKKPGRKRLEVTESNTKKEKNRVAQRAWRERKEMYVIELENKIKVLENAKNKSEHEKQQLKLIIEKLRNENTYLKNATSFIFTPTKEAQMFMEQNKLKVMQQKNLKQNNQAYLGNSVPVGSQEIINGNNNPVFENNTNEESLPALTNLIEESILSGSDPEVLNELYKLLNIQNPELVNYPDSNQPPKDNTLQIPDVQNQDPQFNPALMTPNSLMSNASPNLSNTTNQELLSAINSSNPSNDIYNMISPLQKDNLVIQNNDYNANSTTDPSNQNLLLLMNEQNQQKNNLTQSILEQQQQLNSINPPLVGALGSNNAALPNTAIDQNSLLTMSLYNSIPATYNMQQPTLTSASDMQNLNNNLYTLNTLQVNNPATKPIVSGSMNYRTEPVKEKNQPISDELFNNVIQLLHQQQTNLDVNDEDDILIQQINQSAREMYSKPIVGIPSPSSTVNYGKENYGKENPSTPDNGTLPYTPEDLDTESNKSGEIEYVRTRSIPASEIPDVVEEDDDNNESTSREVKMDDNNDKRNNSSHSTLQFPSEQKPTKILIPYSVFPRVTQETVDDFINEAKLSEEELECLCSELKNKATCKEKLKYISNNIEIPGWTMEKWQKGRIKKDKNNENEKENEKEKENENNKESEQDVKMEK
jgi:hypothetical protein